MEAINRFIKGIVADYSPVDVSNQHWVFPTVNVRITKQGDTFLVKPVSGNEELFKIPTGYRIIGAEEYFDIIYFVLFNDTNQNVQLGSYPYYNGTVKTFAYRPLQCLDDGFGAKAPFDTATLGFDGSNVDIVFAESYDDTIDLYLNTPNSPTIKINSNMSTTGDKLNLITESELPFSVVLVSDAANPMSIDTVTLQTGGHMEPGKYIFFLRYSTKDFNKTTFITESSPIDIHGTVGATYKAGSFLLDDGETEYVNARAQLAISNRDESFPYYQVGVLIASGNPDEEISYKSYLISKYISTDQATVTIDGYESRETLSLDEIAAISFSDNINKCQVVIDNKYVGGNWESEGYDRTSLGTLAMLITVDSAVSISGTVTEEATYFPGEINPFGVVFRFTDGRESETFPISGKDLVTGLSLAFGLVRFPYTPIGGDHLNFGLKLFNTALDDALVLEANSHIAGYTIVRGDRIKNTIANGIGVGMIDNTNFPAFPLGHTLYNKYGGIPQEYFYSKEAAGAHAIPDFFDGTIPMYKSNYTDKIGFNFSDILTEFKPDPTVQLTKRVAFYSPDVTLDKTLKNYENEQVYVFISGTLTSLTKNLTEDASIFNIDGTRLMYNHFEYLTKSLISWTTNAYTINATFVESGIKRVGGMFSAFFPDFALDTDTAWTRRRYYNNVLDWGLFERSSLFGSYMGLSSDSDISSLINKPLVLQRFPDTATYLTSATENFQLRNTIYYKVSQYKAKDTFASFLTIANGDSYLGTVYLRGVKWFGARLLYETENTDKYVYHHGTLLSFNCFSSVNFYMRGEVESRNPLGALGKYTFWPRASIRNTLEGWGILSSNEEDMHESTSINPGYNLTHSIKQYIGYDNVAPDATNKYPTRLRSSAVRVKGAFSDGFKTFYENEKIDISERYGPIIDIFNLFGILIVVQKNAISQVYTNVRQVSSEGSFDIVTGSSQTYLYDKTYVKSYFGAAHRDHIKETEKGVYGIDVENKVIWFITTGATAEGKQVSQVIDIGKEKMISSYIFDLLAFLNDRDYTIAIGYDKFNREVLFTIKYADGAGLPVYENSYLINGYYYITLVFSEDLGAFTGLYALPSDYYVQFRTNLVSILSNVSIHYKTSSQLNFFGQDYTMLLSWIANSSEEAPALVKKFFESILISCPEIPFKNIKFTTEKQESSIDPFIDAARFWETPKYTEFQYEISIPPSQTAGVIFDEESVMKGFWLKITVEFEGEEDFYMIHTSTLFNPINY